MVFDFNVILESTFGVSVDVESFFSADEADVMHVVLFALFGVSKL
jgi:hypothetical protein